MLGITTEADKRLDVLLTDIGGKGLFVKELEEALLDGRADIAVHSMKDVPMALPPGLILPVIGEREDPRDVFVSNQYATLSQCPQNALIGTSSLRRKTQLYALRSDLTIRDLRGNIQTRLKKLDAGEYDAIILAGAGLKRMQLASRIKSYLSIADCLPSAGQGALGIECRADDEKIKDLIAPLRHPETSDCVLAERAVCRQLNGGCKVPIGAYADIHRGVLTIRGIVANHDGTKILRAHLSGEPQQAESLGTRVAVMLQQQGADRILREFQ